MPVFRSHDSSGRERISVSPPRREIDARRLEAENERLRRKIIDMQLEKKLGACTQGTTQSHRDDECKAQAQSRERAADTQLSR